MCGFSKTTWVLLIAVGVGLWMQFVKRGPMCTSQTDLSGRTVIVTGGNVGIGYESALGLLKRNARVIIVCRNEKKAKTAVEMMKKDSGKSTIDYVIVDFADMNDIKQAAKEIMEKEERLDILVNNAGAATTGKTKDGLDMMFGVNHIGYFMLTNLLMPLMRKTSKKSPVRIINVSSDGYKIGTIDFDNLNPDIGTEDGMVGVMKQYSNTKLMNIYFTSELDARLKEEFKGQEQAITTYSLHPGTIHTNFGKDLVGDLGIGYDYFRDFFIALFSRPTVYGAQTTLCCCLEDGIEKHSGGYFSDIQHAELWSNAVEPGVGKKLWEVSEKISGVYWKN